jgi:hypothetical protein
MAYPNFKNGPKNGLGPLGVNIAQFFLKFSKNVIEEVFWVARLALKWKEFLWSP